MSLSTAQANYILSHEVVDLLLGGKREAFELSVVTGAPLVGKRCSPWTVWRKTA